MELNQEKLISVIIPFYNEKDYFNECFISVINQTYKNLEIIIVNDGSDEHYKKKLENLQIKYSKKIRVFHQQNKGVSSARNFGIKQSKGEYIAFIDADDVWLPHKLEYQLEKISTLKVKFLHGSYLVVDEDEKFIGKFKAENLNYEQLFKSCDIGLSTVLIDSDLIKRNLFKNISTKEDYVCWLAIVKEIRELIGDKEVVMKYRSKEKSLSSNFLIKFYNAFKVYFIYEKKSLFYSLYSTFILTIKWFIKTYKIIYKYPEKVEFKFISDVNQIQFEKSFYLSGLNMASLSNINMFYLNHNNIIFWPDGYCAKYLIKDFVKTPGRKIINDFKLPKNVNKIYLCGNESKPQKNYLEKKFHKTIYTIKLPFFKNIREIKKFKLDIEDNSLIILNISTPKQEIMANQILIENKNKKIFIFCLGGGMSMISGEEKIVPEDIEKLNLEWLWRLRTNTFFRLKRLLLTSYLFIFKRLTNYFDKMNLTKLN